MILVNVKYFILMVILQYYNLKLVYIFLIIIILNEEIKNDTE